MPQTHLASILASLSMYVTILAPGDEVSLWRSRANGSSLIWCVLDEAQLPAKIVIQDSAIQYLQPITWDFTASCCLPEEPQVARFLATLQRRGRARLELHAEIWKADSLAVTFTGRYVAQRNKEGLGEAYNENLPDKEACARP